MTKPLHELTEAEIGRLSAQDQTWIRKRLGRLADPDSREIAKAVADAMAPGVAAMSKRLDRIERQAVAKRSRQEAIDKLAEQLIDVWDRIAKIDAIADQRTAPAPIRKAGMSISETIRAIAAESPPRPVRKRGRSGTFGGFLS